MDKYDRAIKYLTANPDKIYEAWLLHQHPKTPVEKAHCLFYVARPSPLMGAGSGCGCLTQIRADHVEGRKYKRGVLGKSGRIRDALTARIASDTRLPKWPGDITPENLPVFAGWQRRLDKELGR